MSINFRAVEREEADLTEQYENGQLTGQEYDRALNDLYRDVQGAIEEEAQDAYDAVKNGY